MADPQHAVQEDLGERDHHERMEQLQMGDLNAETSIEASKQGSVEPMEAAGRSVEGEEDRMPRILTSPNTQHRKL
jgi:hypothetical protein